MKRITTLLTLLLIAVAVSAQRIKKVSGEYTYYAPASMTVEAARYTALERAKLKAMEEEFGTVVAQYNTKHTGNINGKSHSDFSSVGSTEVKGEWIETLGEPTYDIRYEGEMLVVTCKVKGTAREITAAAIDYSARILRNGTDDKFESDEFRSGDDLFLSFQSPVSGYLAVYLIDADRQAFCLLPYRNQTEGIYPIEANRRYVFFNEKEAPAAERPVVDEYTMTCESLAEHNQIYVVFSSSSFTKATDTREDEGLPRQLPFEAFNRWLVKHRKNDKEMTVRILPLTVTRQ